MIMNRLVTVGKATSCFRFPSVPWGLDIDPVLDIKVGNNALKIMDWILEEMASSVSKQGGEDKDLRNALLG